MSGMAISNGPDPDRRIAALQREIDELLRRVAALERAGQAWPSVGPVWPAPAPWAPPFTVTSVGGTLAGAPMTQLQNGG